MNPFEYHREKSETVHKELRAAHWGLVKARENVNKAIRLFGQCEEYSDRRKCAQEWSDELKKLRELIESAQSLNSRISVDLIRTTGCDGSCNT